MNAYYLPGLQMGLCTLSDDEGRHCSRVLRQQVGERVLLLSGEGLRGVGVLRAVPSRGEVLVEVESVEHVEATVGQQTYLLVAPTKQMERMEWMVEKCVEIGVGRIGFMECAHSERRILKLDRLRRVAVSALKQSQSCLLPHFDALAPFKKCVSRVGSRYHRLIAHFESGVTEGIGELGIGSAWKTCVAIGPEGGFSPSELTMAYSLGFLPTSLGMRRLRTETAAIVACVECNRE